MAVDPIKFIDLHAHFPMHTRFPPMPFENPLDFWKAGVFDTLNATVNFEDLKPRVSLDRWFKDNQNFAVTGLGSVLYDAQDDFFVGTAPIPRAIDHICAQIKNVEAEINADGRVNIAYTPAQVEGFLNAGQRFIFHTLEGGFSVGDSAANVNTLADAGVAYIIPAHLLYRGVATCENGFPPSVFPLFKRELEEQPNLGLTDLGKAIVETCFQRGVIVDITHARADARQDIFEIAAGYPDRPLISSHNGVQAICDAGLNLSDDSIKRIQQSNGIIGVIFYPQWLRHLEGDDPRPDLQLITDVIDYIYAVTSSYENIGIGSDQTSLRLQQDVSAFPRDYRKVRANRCR
jgi:microsomal dipeptidase-like Zn-dependent dipeptidase